VKAVGVPVSDRRGGDVRLSGDERTTAPLSLRRDNGPGERVEVQNPRLSLSVDELYAGIVLDEG